MNRPHKCHLAEMPMSEPPNRRIVVMVGDPVFRVVVATALALGRYDVRVVASAEEAAALVVTWQAELVVSDGQIEISPGAFPLLVLAPQGGVSLRPLLTRVASFLSAHAPVRSLARACG